jgi:hypothetical protein
VGPATTTAVQPIAITHHTDKTQRRMRTIELSTALFLVNGIINPFTPSI